MSFNEWKEYFLGDLVGNLSSKRIPLSSRQREDRKGVYPYYGAQGIIDYIDDYIFDGEYLLVAEDGNNLKERKEDIAQIAKGKFWVNNHAHVLVENNNSDIRFIKYYLNQLDIAPYITGSAQPKLNKANLSKIRIVAPNKAEQVSISNFLGKFDDKIELNNQMNETLEEMAQTLFKRWFVDFEFPNEEGQPYKSSGGEMIESELGLIPKGWEVKSLDSSIIFQNGYAFKSKDLLDKPQENCYHVFKMGHIIKGGGLNKLGTKSYICKSECDNLGKFVLKKGDLLMCMTDMKNNVALLGHTALMDEDNKYILNQRVGLIRVKNPELINYPYLYMLTNSRMFIDELRSRANSGVQVNLSTKEIKESLFVCPNKLIHEKFNNLVEIIFEKKFSIGYENECLRNLRDTLLPKLMSGEIRVSDLEE